MILGDTPCEQVGARSGDPEIIELGRSVTALDPPQRMGVGLAPPGFYKSACAKGYGSGCVQGERRSIDLKYPPIEFFMFESASSYFFWNEERNEFERIWISD